MVEAWNQHSCDVLCVAEGWRVSWVAGVWVANEFLGRLPAFISLISLWRELSFSLIQFKNFAIRSQLFTNFSPNKSLSFLTETNLPKCLSPRGMSFPPHPKKQFACLPGELPTLDQMELLPSSFIFTLSLLYRNWLWLQRYLQDHPCHRPPTFGCLPWERLRRRPAHQHPLDHLGLHSWNHSRALYNFEGGFFVILYLPVLSCLGRRGNVSTPKKHRLHRALYVQFWLRQ